VTTKEVQWAMKHCSDEWKVLVDSKKGSKGKKQEEVGPSQKSNNPVVKTRKEIE
jgi:hypothetical protein